MANADETPAKPSPLDFLKTWAEANPQQATVLLAGVACFAAVAIVLGFGIDLQANVKNVYIVLGVGVSLLVVTRILNNELMANALTWFALLIGMAWLVVFIVFQAGLGDPVTHQRLGCLVKFWQDCQLTADQLGAQAAPKINSGAFSDITRNQPPAPAPNLAVKVQFAGAIERDTIRTMMKDLTSKNWKVLGVAGGGERTAKAATYAEVRYSGANKAAAEALARAVSAYGIAGRPLTAVSNAAVDPNELEVWISN